MDGGYSKDEAGNQIIDPEKLVKAPEISHLYITYKTPKTPEPATATLSLPALAGLCAHRRRH